MSDVVLPIGKAGFRSIRESGCYYVDKTSVISRLIRSGADSILFTRPRRFGKTTLQTMLSSFFDIRQDSRAIFAGLEVMDDELAVSSWMNRYPVIYLTLKDIDGKDADEAVEMLRRNIGNLFKSYSFILDGTMFDDDRTGFLHLMTSSSSIVELKDSLRLLARLLNMHYGTKAIIIIDEYDVPLAKAEEHGYYGSMLDILRSMFSSVLKDNPNVEKSVLTGCLRISKESLFTGLNNIAVYSITGSEYTDCFGFTEKEVQQLLQDTDLSDKADLLREWYDGYRIGNDSLYTPWDVLLFVDKLQKDRNGEPENYWANTSGNDAVRHLIDNTEAAQTDDYSLLLNGKSIMKRISETLTYSNIYSDPENIWSLLLATGYLTIDGAYIPNGLTSLRLPNEEIRNLFASVADEWFSETMRRSDRTKLFSAIWEGNAEKLSRILSDYLFRTISYYDYDEKYYHAFLAGLFSQGGYIVRSNAESGNGRPDIIILDPARRRAAIFELKRTSDKSRMSEAAESALRQIQYNGYGEDLEGYRIILKYGIAFCRKEAVAVLC